MSNLTDPISLPELPKAHIETWREGKLIEKLFTASQMHEYAQSYAVKHSEPVWSALNMVPLKDYNELQKLCSNQGIRLMQADDVEDAAIKMADVLKRFTLSLDVKKQHPRKFQAGEKALAEFEAALKSADSKTVRKVDYELSFKEFYEKTEWVQQRSRGFPFPVLGMHRADVMTKYIEFLENELKEAVKSFNDIASRPPLGGKPTGSREAVMRVLAIDARARIEHALKSE